MLADEDERRHELGRRKAVGLRGQGRGGGGGRWRWRWRRRCAHDDSLVRCRRVALERAGFDQSHTRQPRGVIHQL